MEVKKIVEGMTAIQVAEVIDNNFKDANKELHELGHLITGSGGGISIDLSGVQSQACSLGSADVGWYLGSTNASHKAVKLDGDYGKITIVSDKLTFVGFLTSAYHPPYNQYDAIPYVSGTGRIQVEANTPTTLEIPFGSAYVVFTTRDGAGNDINFPVVSLISNKGILPSIEKLESELKDVVEVVNGGGGISIDLSGVQSQACSLGSADVGWYLGSTNASHKSVKLDGSYSKITIVSDKLTFVGFLTSAYHPPYNQYDAIPYVSGTGRIQVEANTPTTLEIPFGSAYVVFTTRDGAGNNINFPVVSLMSDKGILSSIEKLESGLGDVEEVVNGGGGISIDLSGVQSQACSLGSADVGWYLGSTNASHKSVKLDGDYGKITIVSDKLTFVGFLTSAYNPPYNQHDAIPYVSGTGRIQVEANTPTTLEIPFGSAYVVFTTRDGAGNDIAYSKIEASSGGLVSEVKRNSEQVKKALEDARIAVNGPKGVFCVMSYNVGGWYNGTGVSIPLSASELYVPLQEQILERYNSDIIFIQEYRDSVVTGDLTSDELLSYYNLYSISGDTSYNGKAIASKSRMVDIVEGIFTNNDGLNRNYLKGYIYCNGKKVAIISTHLSTSIDIASLQVDELIELIRNEEYVVLGMDSNIDVLSENGKSIMKKITDSGFHYINKDIITYPRTGLAIDNIIISNNITVKSVYADTQKSGLGDDADHYPLLAYIEIF